MLVTLLDAPTVPSEFCIRVKKRRLNSQNVMRFRLKLADGLLVI